MSDEFVPLTMPTSKKGYQYADVRFNSGYGALLCNTCKIIIAYGSDHEDREHFCETCSVANKDEI